MSESLDRSMSSLSITSVDSQGEDDWDRSLSIDPDQRTLLTLNPDATAGPQIIFATTTPRNSIVFPAEDMPTPGRSSRYSSSAGSHSKHGSVDSLHMGRNGKRTLSELLRLHSEKGSNGKFSPEEASRIADVLGQWINASSSPYEAEDDFFARSGGSQDDMSIASKRPIPVEMGLRRPRGRSESANSASNSRPPSSAGFVPS
ncbi:hypothetical protein B0H34DRAFT_710210 [Crassisporium funariophilum]|nr:hypothetical protein B0H34DRAFT_710210 [Crassisporium funariophilum]